MKKFISLVIIAAAMLSVLYYIWPHPLREPSNVVEESDDDAGEPSGKQHETAFTEQRDLAYNSKITGRRFEVYNGSEWRPFTVKGVNMGMGKPGHFPGEAAIEEYEYYRWFEQIGAMNANAVRIYTIQPPGFYEALLRYNEQHARPLYLFQGVWIDEEPLEETLDAFTPEISEAFQSEMKRAVDVIHGNAVIDPRPGHARGVYEANISPYVIGWIIGIEWYPLMVHNMTQSYPDLAEFEGMYVSTADANGMEHWLAVQLDILMTYEADAYGWIRPVSFTNWVSTDLLNHPAEPNKEEDLATVDPNKLYVKGDASDVGMFASYHVYPYYPEFLNLEEKYVNYIDHRGERNNYAGYLRDLHTAHKLPVLIAEFGVPASRGLTHLNPFGWNQGFLTESRQGDIIVRLFEDIVQEGMLGGLVFSWQDEWFKRTWNTMDYDNPDRRPFWSNAQTNEQQFGLLSFDRLVIKPDGAADDWEGIEPIYQNDNQLMRRLYATHDERYFYLRLDFEPGASRGKLFENYAPLILFDVHPAQGKTEIDDPEKAAVRGAGIDFMLRFTGAGEAELLVDSYYDAFYYQYGYQLKLIEYNPALSTKEESVFQPIRLALNRELVRPDTREVLPFEAYETGKLRHGNGNPDSPVYDSLSDFYYDERSGMLEIRLPWQLLNIKDPSRREILDDLYVRGLTGSLSIDGIRIAAALTDAGGRIIEAYPQYANGGMNGNELALYSWEMWELPEYEERLKQSYWKLQEHFAGVD